MQAISVADLGGAQGAPPPPLGAQILSISCSFRENLAKSYVGAPPPPPPGELAPLPGEILDPPLIAIFYFAFFTYTSILYTDICEK